MLSTLRSCGIKKLVSKELLSLGSGSKVVTETVVRRNYASLIFSKSQNVKNVVGKSKRLFSTEAGATEAKAAESATGAKAATEEAAAAGSTTAGEGASGPKTYRTVKEGQEIMAVKVVRSAKKASKGALWLFIGAASVVTAVAIVREILPSRLSGTGVFHDAVKIVLDDPDINRYLGGNLKCYGKDFGGQRAGRRNWIENYVYEDEEGLQHCRIKFNVEGNRGKGEVFAEKSKEMGPGEFHYLVYVDGNTGAVVGIIDNRVYLPLEKQRELVVEKLHSIKAILFGMSSSKDTQRQLALLGPLKDRVEYVDCEQRPQACEQAQIAAVPTWYIRGKRFVGYKELDDLEVLCHKEVKK